MTERNRARGEASQTLSCSLMKAASRPRVSFSRVRGLFPESWLNIENFLRGEESEGALFAGASGFSGAGDAGADSFAVFSVVFSAEFSEASGFSTDSWAGISAWGGIGSSAFCSSSGVLWDMGRLFSVIIFLESSLTNSFLMFRRESMGAQTELDREAGFKFTVMGTLP